MASQDATDVAFLLRSALEVEGRLASLLAECVDRNFIVSALEREPLYRIGELIEVLAILGPEKVSSAADVLLTAAGIMGAVEESRDLRETSGALAACRSANCSKWYGVMKSFDSQQRDDLEREFSSRMHEESNLEIAGRALLLVGSFDQRIAENLAAKQDWDWIKSSGRWNNQVTQVLFFLGALWKTLRGSKRYESPIRGLITDSIDRLGEVRSVQAISYTLRYTLRLPRRVGRLDVRGLLEERLPFDLWAGIVATSNDVAGLITITYLVAFFGPSAMNLERLGVLARGRLRATLSVERPINTIAALALIGRRDDHPLWVNSVRRVLSGRPTDYWVVGYGRWLQRACRSGGGDILRPKGRRTDVLQGDISGFRGDLVALAEGSPTEMLRRVGQNLHVAFLLSALEEAGIDVRRDGQLAELVERRIRWEWRRTVSRLLKSWVDGEMIDGRKDWEVVAHTLEKLLPDSEGLGRDYRQEDE